MRLIPVLAVLAGACSELPTLGQDPERNALEGESVQLVRFEEYFPAYDSGFGEQARLVVQNQAQWEAAWQRTWHNHSPVPPAPAVDFGAHVVVLAAMGSRPTGGYSIRVEDAAARSDHVVVRVIETSPGRSCFTTQAFSEPVDIVKLPRTSLPVRFETVKTVHDCG